jgi:hypothetical protein
MERLKLGLAKFIQISQKPRGTLVIGILLLIGLSIRLVLAPFTSHPYDFAGWVTTMERFYNLAISPLYWWKFGTFLNAVFVFSYPWYIGFQQLFHTHNVLLLHLILKIPFILADIGIAVLLFALVVRMGASWGRATLLMSLWLFNPFAIFISAVHGETDAIPAFLVLLSLYLLQRNSYLKSFLSLLAAGMFKYYPLLLIPFFILISWGRTDRRTKVLGLASFVVITLVNYAPVLMDPVNKDRFFTGLTSSVVPNSESAPWSLWVLLRLAGISLSSVPFPPVLVLVLAYSLFLVFFVFNFRHRKFHLSGLSVSKIYLIAIVIFVALDPVSNPQFLVWILPLLLYISFAMKKYEGYVLSTSLWLFNLAALFASFSPNVYLLDALPQVFTYAPAWPYVNYSISDVLKAVYSLLLVFGLLAIVCMSESYIKAEEIKKRETVKPMKGHPYFRISWGSVFTHGMNLLVIGLIFLLVFNPLWFSMYFREVSQRPFDLSMLSHIEYASTVSGVYTDGNFVQVSTQVHIDLAPWLQRTNWQYANASLKVQMLKGTSEQLIVIHEEAGQPALISSSSIVGQSFLLEQASMAIKLKILIGEPENYTMSDLRNLRLSLLNQDGDLIQSFTADGVEREMVVKAWFFYTFIIAEPLSSGTYKLLASVENSALTWYWNGGGSSSLTDERYINDNPTGKTNWIKVYKVPSIEIKLNDVYLGQIVTNRADSFEIPLNDDQLAATENHILLTTDELTKNYLQKAFVEVNLDIRPESPWWSNNLYTVYLFAAVDLILLAIFTIFLIRLLHSSIGIEKAVNQSEAS